MASNWLLMNSTQWILIHFLYFCVYVLNQSCHLTPKCSCQCSTMIVSINYYDGRGSCKFPVMIFWKLSTRMWNYRPVSIFSASVNKPHDPDWIIPDKYRFTTDRERSSQQLNLTRWRPKTYIKTYIQRIIHSIRVQSLYMWAC